MSPTVLVISLVAVGFWVGWWAGVRYGRVWRAIERQRARRIRAPRAPATIEVRRSVARVDVKLLGAVVQTDMEITPAVLELLANGIGKTLAPLPSEAVH